MSHTFKVLLKRLQKNYPSVRAFADALGIDASRLSRGQPFDIKGCLRLSMMTGEPPSVVLRAAGKGDIAALIEALYGASRPGLTPDQQELLAGFGQIRAQKSRRAVLDLVWMVARLPGSGNSTNDEPTGGTGPVIVPEPSNEMRRARTGS